MIMHMIDIEELGMEPAVMALSNLTYGHEARFLVTLA
jgi:hypothetical protein